MLRVGLTGGVGSGKSTVASMFIDLGVPVVDTDIIARDLLRPGQEAHVRVLEAFGPELANARGEIDRAKLRDRVFSDPASRRRLETILHPLIRDETRAKLAALAAPYCVIVVPLLFEAGFRDLVDRVLVVDAEEAAQIARVRVRDRVSSESVRRVLAAQIDPKERLTQADDIIANKANIDDLRNAVFELDGRYQALARASRVNL